nr:uncharacterized protein LOC128690837 [Cherax quadricarinatus]
MNSRDENPHRKRVSLLSILSSLESADELFSTLRNILLQAASGKKLPSWFPDGSRAVLLWTQKVTDLEHVPSACYLVQLLTSYSTTSSNEEVNFDTVIEVYLQMINFAATKKPQNESFQHQLWHALAALFFSLLEYHQDIVSSHFCDMGRSLMKPSLDSTKPINLRSKCLKELNELMKLFPNEARDTFRKNCSDLFVHLPSLLQEIGDYDTQATIVETIYRMTTAHERSRCVSRWFPDLDFTLQSLFIMITEFDPDCRRFLNAFNAILGPKRKVYTFSCNSASTGKMKLHKPQDPSYQKFWIDFNLGNNTILLLCRKPYNSEADSFVELPWESLTLEEEDMKTVTLTRTIHVYSLEIVMKKLDTVLDLFVSPLSQESRCLLSETFLLEFSPLEILERLCTHMFGEKFKVVLLEPEGWVNIAARNTSAQSGEPAQTSSSNRKYRKSSMNVLHCKTSSSSTSDRQSEVCVAKKRKVEQVGTTLTTHLTPSQSSSGYGAKKHRKSSVTYSSEPSQTKKDIALEEKLTQKSSLRKFTKTSECSLNLDSDDMTSDCEIIAIDGTTRSTGVQKKPAVKNIKLACKDFSDIGKQLEESPMINCTTQDAMLLNLAMDSVEGQIESERIQQKSNVTVKKKRSLFKFKKQNPQKMKLYHVLLLWKLYTVEDKEVHREVTDIQHKKTKAIKKTSAIKENLQATESRNIQPTLEPLSEPEKNETPHKCKKAANKTPVSLQILPEAKVTKVYPLRNRIKSQNLNTVSQQSPKHRNIFQKNIKASPKTSVRKKRRTLCKNSVSPSAEHLPLKALSPLEFAYPASGSTTAVSTTSRIDKLTTSPSKGKPHSDASKYISELNISSIKSPKLTSLQVNAPQFTSRKAEDLKLDREITAVTPETESSKTSITSKNDTSCFATPKASLAQPATPRASLMQPATPRASLAKPATPRALLAQPATPRASPVQPATPQDKTVESTTRVSMVQPPTQKNYMINSTTPRVSYLLQQPDTPGANLMQPPFPETSLLQPATPRDSLVQLTAPKDSPLQPATPRDKTVQPTTTRANMKQPTTTRNYVVQTTTPLVNVVPPTTPKASPMQSTTPRASTLPPATPTVSTMQPIIPRTSTIQSTTPKNNSTKPVISHSSTQPSNHLSTPTAKYFHSSTFKAGDIQFYTPVQYPLQFATQKTATSAPVSPVTKILIPVTHNADSVLSFSQKAEQILPTTPKRICNHPATDAQQLLSPVGESLHSETLKAVDVHLLSSRVNTLPYTSPKMYLESDTGQHDIRKPNFPNPDSTGCDIKRPDTPWPDTKGSDTPRPDTVWHGTHWPKILDLDASLSSNSKKDYLIPKTFAPTIYKDLSSLPAVPFIPLSPKVTPSRANSPCYDSHSKSFVPTPPDSINVSMQGFSQCITEGSQPRNNDHNQSVQISSDFYVPVNYEQLGKEIRYHILSSRIALSDEIILLSTLNQENLSELVELDISKNESAGMLPVVKLNAAHLSGVDGKKKSPSKALMSTLMILADYPVKSSSLKTPTNEPNNSDAKISGKEPAKTKVKTQKEEKRSKSYPPLQNRSRSLTPTLSNSYDMGVRHWKSKKKLFDTSAVTMLEASPPDDTVYDHYTFADDDFSDSPPKSSVQTIRDVTDSNKKNETLDKSSQNAERSNLSGSKVSSRKYFTKPRKSSASFNFNKNDKRSSKKNKSTKGTRSKISLGSQNLNKMDTSLKSSVCGFFEYPETEEVKQCTHSIYSDLDSSGKETQFSWLYSKKSRKFEGSTYSNRTKSHLESHNQEEGSDDWQPFKKKRKRKVSKEPVNTRREANIKNQTKREPRSRKCRKTLSYVERSTDTDHDALNIGEPNNEQPISEEDSFIQNKSPDILRHTSKSSVESNPPSIREFSLIPSKRKNMEDKYVRARADIDESFGFSSPEVKEPCTRLIRNSVEDMEIKTMVKNILPEQKKISSKLRPVEKVDIAYNTHVVPGPPNNTPESVKDFSTEAFDAGEISEILKDKQHNQNIPSGPLQSTMIDEVYQDTVSTGRFSYVSEAHTSYVDNHVGSNYQNTSGIESQNFSINDPKEKFSSPILKTGISSRLNFDDSAGEDDIQEPFDMMPKHSCMSLHDEKSSSEEGILQNKNKEYEDNACLSKSLLNENPVTSSATAEPLIPEVMYASQDMFSQDKLISPPMPSLQNYSKQSQDGDTTSTQTSTVLNSLLNKLTNRMFSETPCRTNKILTPSRPAPRTLFDTSKGNQGRYKERAEQAEETSQSDQKDYADSLQYLKTSLEGVADGLYRLSAAIGKIMKIHSLDALNLES